MFEEFFTKGFYGNTIGNWLLAALIIIASLALGRAVYWLFKNVFKRWTKKTASKFDDILIDQFEGPLVFAIIIFGIWQALYSVLHFEQNVHVWIGRVYYILIIFNIAWVINRLFDSFVQEYIVPFTERTDSDLDDQLLPVIRRGIKITVWVLAFIIAMNNAGYDVAALLAGLGIGGLAFALAAQDTVSNLFGGFTIFADRPFRVKDRIKFDDYEGWVQEIGLRSTRIYTLEGRIVTIPNSKLANNPSVNVSSEKSRRVISKIGLNYHIQPEKLQEAVDMLNLLGNELVENGKIEKRYYVAFNNFGNYSLELIFLYFIKKGNRSLPTKSEVNLEIFKRLANAEIKLSATVKGFYGNEEKDLGFELGMENE
ncbi:MAG: MscS family membrane protein [Flammeovirgaceae bacterium]|jgi:MscS family membrane protein